MEAGWHYHRIPPQNASLFILFPELSKTFQIRSPSDYLRVNIEDKCNIGSFEKIVLLL